MEETKIIYHIDDEDTPYLIKVPVAADSIKLGDFKNALNRPNYKFFFKSMDDDFGVVKEELSDDEAHLPCFNGRVVSWLVTADGNQTDITPHSQNADNMVYTDAAREVRERIGGIGNSRPPSFHGNTQNSQNWDTGKEAGVGPYRSHGVHRHSMRPHHRTYGGDGVLSVLSSDVESVSVIDSEDTCSRFSSVTGTTNKSSVCGRNRKKRLCHRMPPISQASSMSSITDSTMSLNVMTVALNMDTVSFLGISIVGQTNKGGDGGIYVGSIMKGGAVAQDGRIEPGDMILEVNGVSFEDMTNDEAVQTLRTAAQRPGPITLVVAKCWDPVPKSYSSPRQEPVRPIDPSAWVAHTEAVRAMYGRLGPPPSVTGIPACSTPSFMTSIPESSFDGHSSHPSALSGAILNSSKNMGASSCRLSLSSDVMEIVHAMSAPDSGLEICDRMWLKITVPNAFIGSDLVNWLQTHVDGFVERRDARRYACELLKNGYIRHTVNKTSFSEQCYYTIADICSDLGSLTLDALDSVSDIDVQPESVVYDTLGPPTVPTPVTASWMTQYVATGKPYTPSYISPGIVPLAGNIPVAPYNFVNDAMSLDSLLVANAADTVQSSSESVESVQSQVRVSKPAVVSANDVGKQCTTSQTNKLTLQQELTSSTQLTSPSESDFMEDTESVPAKS